MHPLEHPKGSVLSARRMCCTGCACRKMGCMVAVRLKVRWGQASMKKIGDKVIGIRTAIVGQPPQPMSFNADPVSKKMPLPLDQGPWWSALRRNDAGSCPGCKASQAVYGTNKHPLLCGAVHNATKKSRTLERIDHEHHRSIAAVGNRLATVDHQPPAVDGQPPQYCRAQPKAATNGSTVYFRGAKTMQCWHCGIMCTAKQLQHKVLAPLTPHTSAA